MSDDSDRHLKKIIFSNEDLRYRGLTLKEFKQIFEQLPEDADIIAWGDEYNRMISYFIVESDEFAVVPTGHAIPEQTITFKDEEPVKYQGSIYGFDEATTPDATVWTTNFHYRKVDTPIQITGKFVCGAHEFVVNYDSNKREEYCKHCKVPR